MLGQEAAVSARARGRAPLSSSLMCLSMWTLLHRLDSQGSRNLVERSELVCQLVSE